MSIRTTEAQVKAVMAPGIDYDTVNSPDLTPYIAAASAITDQVVSLAYSRKGVTITDNGSGSLAEIIERWLAAHFYCQSDKPMQTKSAGGASATFVGKTAADGLDSTLYGQTAQRIDISGILRNLDKQQLAGSKWLGKTLDSQLTYDQRNGLS